jgi:hypothetical protein
MLAATAGSLGDAPAARHEAQLRANGTPRARHRMARCGRSTGDAACLDTRECRSELSCNRGTPGPAFSLMDSVRVDAEFGEGCSAVLRALGSAASDALGGECFNLLVGSAGFERLSDGI